VCCLLVILALRHPRQGQSTAGRSQHCTFSRERVTYRVNKGITVSRHGKESDHVKAAEANSFAFIMHKSIRGEAPLISLPPDALSRPGVHFPNAESKRIHVYTIPTLKTRTRTIQIHPFSNREESSQNNQRNPARKQAARLSRKTIKRYAEDVLRSD
jgi:hypothetical protein